MGRRNDIDIQQVQGNREAEHLADDLDGRHEIFVAFRQSVIDTNGLCRIFFISGNEVIVFGLVAQGDYAGAANPVGA